MVITYGALRQSYGAEFADAVDPELLAEANDLVMAGENVSDAYRHIVKHTDDQDMGREYE